MREPPPPRPPLDSDPFVEIESFRMRLAQGLIWAVALILVVVLVLAVMTE